MEVTESSPNPEVAAQAVENHEKTPKESFAELRKSKEELQKAKEESDRQAWQAQKELELWKIQQEQMRQSQMQQLPQQPQEEEFDYRQLENEEFPDGKKLVKALNSFNNKIASYDQKLAEKDQKLQYLETLADPAMKDFSDVVTVENFEKYIKSDEDNREAVEFARQTGKNPLRKAYNLIKKSAAYQADMAQKTAKDKPISQEQQRVDEKEGKPKLGSLGVRSEAVTYAAQTSNSKMTRAQKNALWAETMSAARK